MICYSIAAFLINKTISLHSGGVCSSEHVLPGLWVSADTACMLQGLSGPWGAESPIAQGRPIQLPMRFGQEGAAAPTALPNLGAFSSAGALSWEQRASVQER